MTDPLQQFCYVATHCSSQLSESQIIQGAQAIQRRQALERWKSNTGTQLLKLTRDGGDDKAEDHHEDLGATLPKLGVRYKCPPSLQELLLQKAESQINAKVVYCTDTSWEKAMKIIKE